MQEDKASTTPSPSPPPADERAVIGYAQRDTGKPAGPLEPYNRVAETVGMVPSLRWRDNVVQAAVVLIGTLLGAIVAHWFFDGRTPAPAFLLGALVGLILSTFLSGLFLMILRLARR